jgi:hypothetical protein
VRQFALAKDLMEHAPPGMKGADDGVRNEKKRAGKIKLRQYTTDWLLYEREDELYSFAGCSFAA